MCITSLSRSFSHWIGFWGGTSFTNGVNSMLGNAEIMHENDDIMHENDGIIGFFSKPRRKLNCRTQSLDLVLGDGSVTSRENRA